MGTPANSSISMDLPRAGRGEARSLLYFLRSFHQTREVEIARQGSRGSERVRTVPKRTAEPDLASPKRTRALPGCRWLAGWLA